MKILLATFRLTRSGAGIPSYNQELIKLFGNKHDITVLCGTELTPDEGSLEVFTTAGHSVGDYDYCSRLVDRINQAGYDCIINSGSRFIPVIAPFLKAPIVSVSHFVNGRLAKIAGYNARYHNILIALSFYGRDYLIRKFKIKNPEKVKVVYNFVNDIDFRLIDKKAQSGPLRIVYPGGTSVEKSPDVVQKLIYRLLATDLDFEFYWLGQSTPLPADKYTLLGLKKTTDLFPTDKRLKITGLLPRNEAEKLMMTANIFLLPSRGEGCPMTLLEAMRGGCIAIVSDARHGSREIIESARTGFVVEQGNHRKLAEAIENIIKNHSDYTEWYDKSRGFLNSELSKNIWKNKMEEIFKEAMNCEKIYIPLTNKNFRKSLKGYKRIVRYEKLREKLRNAWYRIIIDSSYVGWKFGIFGN